MSVLSPNIAVLLATAITGAVRSPPPAPSAAMLVPGYFSAAGLPPVPGWLQVTDSNLTFRSGDGALLIHRRRVDQTEPTPQAEKRSGFQFDYVSRAGHLTSYIFRLDDGIFETTVPGELLQLVAHPVLLNPTHSPSPRGVPLRLTGSAFADTLYALFGRPRAVGLVSAAGRGRLDLAEYVGGLDSLAFDLERMAGETQLRHAFAHEMGHRWATLSPDRLDSLWHGVPEIQDPRRYGYGNKWEQQAEAIAFAVHFLQITTRSMGPEWDDLELLGHYDLLVPGTRLLVRYLVRQPIYQHHPLRAALIRLQ